MFTTSQRRNMLMFAGVITGFLLGFLALNIFNLSAATSSVNERVGVIAGFVIAGIIAGLILEKATRAKYQAAFAHGKNPILAANKKLPGWYTDTRMNRSSYWTINIILFVALIVIGVIAIDTTPYPLSSWIIGILAVIFLGFRLILMRFRMNDISPETQIELSSRGGMGLFGGWLMDFAPSHKRKESSFKQVQEFYLPQGKPNVKNISFNVRTILIYFAIIIGLFLLLAALR
jgi:hypothetical protein